MLTQTLFPKPESAPDRDAPLAERMRPASLNEVVGQNHLIGDGKVVREMVARDQLSSLLFWGPPGTGKTTLARIIARETKSPFVAYSAVLSGIKEIKTVMADAERHHAATRRRTIVFIDEIHRFNKAQQDAFLPYVESGVIVLIGATTENPSFEVIGALLSRVKVYILVPLAPGEIVTILQRALADTRRGLGAQPVRPAEGVLERLAAHADGDARIALNALEIAASLVRHRSAEPCPELTLQDLEQALQKKIPLYDKGGEEHFNLISALHKSMRNSDPDAALYWLGRMIESGEDPLYIARRMVRFASEDVGLADLRALSISLEAARAVRLVGLPECKLALAQAAVYLSIAAKSNAIYVAYSAVEEDVQKTPNEPPPLHIRNAPTDLMRDLGYGRGYQYAHDLEGKVADMPCLPESLRGRRYYTPSSQGAERRIQEILEEIRKRRARAGSG
ncbi:MAG: replication-associated recombination protein A [Acidobacteriota bacterium]